MKSLLSKYFVGVVLLFSVVGFVGCGSDDDDNITNNNDNTQTKSIDIAVGKYKGTMDSDVYDVTLTVEKVDDTHVRVSVDKKNEKGKLPTSKVLLIPEYPSSIYVQDECLDGFFSYNTEDNLIFISTTSNSETDITFSFKGEKQ